MLLVVFFTLIQQCLDPRDQRLVSMIGVHGDTDAVVLGQQVHMLGSGYRTHYLGGKGILDATAGIKLPAGVG